MKQDSRPNFYIDQKYMKATLYIICIVTLVFLYSCNERTIENGTVRTGDTILSFSKGKLLEKIWYTHINDTSELIRIAFDIDGKQKDSSRFFKGNIVGLRMQYDPSDSSTTYANYSNGIQEGRSVSYYPNGIKWNEGECKGKKQIGAWKFYNRAGNLMSYEYFSVYGDRLYLRKYNANSHTVKSMGTAMIEHKSTNNDTVKHNDCFSTVVELANPPKCIVRLKVGQLSKERKIIGEKEFSVDDNHSRINYCPQKAGRDTIACYWEITDSLTGKIESGINLIPIYVK
jgi:antitoxin component YwqK of YwqJK toxin-antitoxin module